MPEKRPDLHLRAGNRDHLTKPKQKEPAMAQRGRKMNQVMFPSRAGIGSRNRWCGCVSLAIGGKMRLKWLRRTLRTTASTKATSNPAATQSSGL